MLAAWSVLGCLCLQATLLSLHRQKTNFIAYKNNAFDHSYFQALCMKAQNPSLVTLIILGIWLKLTQGKMKRPTYLQGYTVAMISTHTPSQHMWTSPAPSAQVLLNRVSLKVMLRV